MSSFHRSVRPWFVLDSEVESCQWKGVAGAKRSGAPGEHASGASLRSAASHPMWFVLVFILAFLILCTRAVAAEDVSRVLPPGKLPDDARLGDLTTLNGYFPFVPSDSPEAWAKRSERLRRQLLVATGLWPMPTKTPANAVIHGKVDRDDYTVERVYLQSFPGHYVTGSLYRPKGVTGRRPGVLCPHGHWADGRFYDAGEASVRKQIEEGGEQFEIGGRHPIQARCVQLARMGCVVFQYDMVGYADSQQIQHRPGIREKMNTNENWGYFSPQAELRQQSMMGLQTYNSIRTLDWFRELPDVDPDRIAVTGASGGGTQTFILCAADTRPAVAFPAVMVSTAMQGGCTCENACYLRVDTGNVELAALIAPRPLGMSAADDWTKEMTTKGFPELKQHYKMLGVPDRVMLHSRTEFGHNYNYPTRLAMYGWLNKHLKLGLDEPIVEKDYRPLTKGEATVFDDDHPRPDGGDEHERALLKWITEDSEKQIAALTPTDEKSLAEYRRVVGGAVDVMIGRGVAEPGAVEVSDDHVVPQGGQLRRVPGLLRYPGKKEVVPILVLQLTDNEPDNQLVIWVDTVGKRGLLGANGKPKPPIAKLLATGTVVIGIDLFDQGEFTANGKPIDTARLVNNNYAGYTFGYNHPPFAKRVHNVLSLLSVNEADEHSDAKVYLVGLNGAGPWVAAAAAQAGDAIDGVVIDTAGFRFADLTAIDHPDFLPGGAKYGDLPGMIALSAPRPMWLAGEGKQVPPIVAAAYKAAGKPENLTTFQGGQSEREMAAVEWLLKQQKP